ncbi:hypothetical protein [Flavobacterium flavipallidum]|uniref:Uncharacterized protein n=1 Tax=Flavobacterium flavipallidum TaxID=3139140 RepID=A0ABU9HPA9_9FLAO
MKTVLLYMLTLLFVTNIFSQTQNPSFTKENYLEKSKKQKRTGWIILGTGLGLGAVGGLVQLRNSNTTSYGSGFDFDFTGVYIAIGGGVVALASIPCFISAAKNKKMALSITMNQQNILLPINNEFVIKHPSLSLKIEL